MTIHMNGDSGHLCISGASLKWKSEKRSLNMEAETSRKFIFKGIGQSSFELIIKEKSILICMDGIEVTVRPKTGTVLEDIKVTLSNKGQLEIKLPKPAQESA